MQRLQSEFLKPDSSFRPVPFWSWNDLLDDKELVRQISEMNKAGLGGYFMHARVGLETPYLTEEWFKRVRTGIKAAKKFEMDAWLYDEDKWPSGFAGGLIPRKGEMFREKALVCSEKEISDESYTPLAFFTLNDRGGFTRFEEKPPESDEKILYFYRWVEPMGNRWFNGTAYIDTLNPAVVKAFIESTYKKYVMLFRENITIEVPGIFTDEPCYMMYNFAPKPSLPWTDTFPENFRNAAGYDLFNLLPCLFYDIGNFEKVRYDYFKTATELFLEAYSKQIYQFCEENRLIYTGHFMAEQSLCSQIKWIGSAMPHYEYMTYPGIDHLNRGIKKQLLTIKQVSSVADQFGKKRALSETYGCSGWNMSFEDQKWIAEWQIALGINLINPHLSLYSSRGSRKRDFPPSLHYQQPWWKQYNIINDHLTRLCTILSKGDRKCNIMIIHPIETGWITYNPTVTCQAEKYNSDFEHVCERLISIQRDFHLGDESILQNHGFVADANLEVGNGSYHVVIIPPLLTLREKTVNLLKEFNENGGHLIFVEKLPVMINGQHTNVFEEYFEDCKIIPNSRQHLKEYLDYILPRSINIVSDDGDNPNDIVLHHREINFNDVVFLVNSSRDKSYRTRLSFAGSGNLQLWNPANGFVKDLKVEVKDEIIVANLRFEPTQSYLLVLNRQQEPNPYKKLERELARTIKMGKEYILKVKNENSLTIDYCRYKIDAGEWSNPRYVLDVQNELMKHGKGKNIIVEYSFTSNIAPSELKDAFIAVECPERFKITMNGKKVFVEDNCWWTDIAFRKIPVGPNLKKGKNVLRMETVFEESLEIESVYFCGNFSVTGPEKHFTIEKPVETYYLGNLSEQGFPFFCGSVVISRKLQLIPKGNERIFLRLPSMDAIICNVKVNGTAAGSITWQPLSIEVTEFITEGKNKIELELIGSCRNLLGPHHNSKGELLSVDPNSFNDKKRWTDMYKFVPFGLLDEPEIIFYTTE